VLAVVRTLSGWMGVPTTFVSFTDARAPAETRLIDSITQPLAGNTIIITCHFASPIAATSNGAQHLFFFFGGWVTF
jgi:hypothetical protein